MRFTEPCLVLWKAQNMIDMHYFLANWTMKFQKNIICTISTIIYTHSLISIKKDLCVYRFTIFKAKSLAHKSSVCFKALFKWPIFQDHNNLGMTFLFLPWLLSRVTLLTRFHLISVLFCCLFEILACHLCWNTTQTNRSFSAFINLYWKTMLQLNFAISKVRVY